jgi:hypothetical protein
MAFHFQVMPRMFMAVRPEQATPIYEILAQTPAIPVNLVPARRTQIDPTLLSAGEAAVANRLWIFELESAIHEFRCELDNRPDWLLIHQAAIARLLEAK